MVFDKDDAEKDTSPDKGAWQERADWAARNLDRTLVKLQAAEEEGDEFSEEDLLAKAHSWAAIYTAATALKGMN